MSLFSLIFSSRPLVILMSPDLDLMVGQLSWRQEPIAEVIPSMRWLMEATVLVGPLPRSWSKFPIIFCLYISQLHLLRLFVVQIGWSLMFVRMCSTSGQW